MTVRPRLHSLPTPTKRPATPVLPSNAPARSPSLSALEEYGGRSSARRWPWPVALRVSLLLHGAAAGCLLLDPASWPWALALVGGNHLALLFLSLAPRAPGLGPNHTQLSRAARAARKIALTFDDGPDPDVTPRVLELLARHQARATFFCVGERARAYPELVAQITRAGHAVENHTDRHALDFAFWGPRRMAADLRSAQDTFVGLGVAPPRFVRAPAGMRNPWFDWAAHRAGLECVSWSRRAFDTVISNEAVVRTHLKRGLRPGAILLLHDGHAARTADGTPVVLAVLPGLLEAIDAAGLATVALREALP